MGSLTASAKLAFTLRKILADMELDTLLFKGTRAVWSISFVVMKADLWQEQGVVLKQEHAELTVVEVVQAMCFQHAHVVIGHQVVTVPTVLPAEALAKLDISQQM